MNFDFNIIFECNSDFSAVVGMERRKNLVLGSAVEVDSYNVSALKILKIVCKKKLFHEYHNLK